MATVVRLVEDGDQGMGIVFELSTVDVKTIAEFVKGRRKRRPGPEARRPARAQRADATLAALRDQTIRPLWILKVVAFLALAGGVAMLLTC